MKKNKIVKLALDARELNKVIVKDKYRTPNMDHLLDLVAEQLERPEREARFTSLDMHYAYGQVPLDTKAAEQCSFQIVGAEPTGTYRFSTGFCGLTTKSTELQKKLNQTLDGFSNTYTFIENVLVVSKGKETKLWGKVLEKFFVRLDAMNDKWPKKAE